MKCKGEYLVFSVAIIALIAGERVRERERENKGAEFLSLQSGALLCTWLIVHVEQPSLCPAK